jgi:hypothetical protein
VEEKEGAAEEEEVVAGGGGGRRRGCWPWRRSRGGAPCPRVRAYCGLRVPAMRMESWNGRRLGLGLGVGVWQVGWLILFVGPDGPSGLLGLVPAHGPHRAECFRAVLGRHYGLRL